MAGDVNDGAIRHGPSIPEMVGVTVRADGQRRVVLLRRIDGLFTFVEQAGYALGMARIDLLKCRSWASLPSGGGIYETAAGAEREARASIGWLRDEPTT